MLSNRRASHNFHRAARETPGHASPRAHQYTGFLLTGGYPGGVSTLRTAQFRLGLYARQRIFNPHNFEAWLLLGHNDSEHVYCQNDKSFEM